VLPVRGGIVLDLGRLDAIREINREDLYAVVEAGVKIERLANAVGAAGLLFPPDPSSARAATMGGGVAENAGGPHAFKYGVFRDYVLGLTAVTIDGTVLHTGGRTVKNVSGYDLTRLLVGSEGTLAVIVEATVKLIPQPQAKRTLLTVYDRLEDAAQTVSRIIAAGMQPAALEFIDDASMRVVEDYLHLGLPLDAEALLLIEVDGSEPEVARQAEEIAALCRAMHARDVTTASNEFEAQELWRARKSISSAVARIKPSKVSEDATVPRSQIPTMVRKLKEIGKQFGVDLVVFGHAGDGNLHPNIMCDETDAEEMARVWQAVAEIFAVTLELGGTLTGEHGVGTMKAPFMRWEHHDAGLAMMRAVKNAWDPFHLLNPGKLFPEDAPPWPIDLTPWETRLKQRENS
jgi:glycolate oxidase